MSSSVPPHLAWSESADSRKQTTVVRRPQHVPDDWDNDDDGDDEDVAERNERLWQEANTRAPMPQVVITGSSTTPTIVAPPAEALQGPLRILKRPTVAKPSPAASSTPPQTSGTNFNGTSPILTRNTSAESSSSTNGQKTLADREAEYQAARDRIFAPSSDNSVSSITVSASNLSLANVPAKTASSGRSTQDQTAQRKTANSQVIRQPKGLSGNGASDVSRGGSTRKGGRKGSTGSGKNDNIKRTFVSKD